MKPRQIYHVARREYIARVRNKAFIFSTLMVPAFLALYMFLIPLLFEQGGPEQLKLAIVDAGTGLARPFASRLEKIKKPKIQIVASLEVREAEKARARYSDQVRSKEIDGYLVLTPGEKLPAKARYFARETGNIGTLRHLERAFQATLLDGILSGSGVDVGQVERVERFDLETVTVSEKGEQEGGFEAAFFSTLAFAMLLYMAVLINGQGMAMAIVEEKSSRLIEVILGAVTALEFMSGKILGVLFSGLTQLAIWVVCALVAVFYALPALAMAPAQGIDLASILNPTIIFYFCIFFTLGYLMYSTLFATVAATCTSTEELSQAMFPAMLPFIIAFMLTFYAVPNPSTTATRVLSLIPLFTPLVMLARVNVLMPPLWEVWLGILLLFLGTLGVAWLSAKVFRFALLMYGKRPTIPEILRLMRAS